MVEFLTQVLDQYYGFRNPQYFVDNCIHTNQKRTNIASSKCPLVFKDGENLQVMSLRKIWLTE
jgi:hypothetical protein